MKRKTDPMLVLAVIVVIGMLGSSLLSGGKTAKEENQHGKPASFAQTITR